jgi:hypothetical protein|tara:strand:- start:626 stop:739 length:114 start_codon:yes stop_codon:yes gene_type:complete
MMDYLIGFFIGYYWYKIIEFIKSFENKDIKDKYEDYL